MRRTKAWFERALEGAIAHQMMPIREVVGRVAWDIRDRAGFTPACQYPYGNVPLPNEIGKVRGVRYVEKNRI